jgi:hypothetical protein
LGPLFFGAVAQPAASQIITAMASNGRVRFRTTMDWFVFITKDSLFQRDDTKHFLLIDGHDLASLGSLSRLVEKQNPGHPTKSDAPE